MAPGEARERLLEAAIDYVVGHGLTDLSLRRLAAELGTSHRMLIHHFGSREGLWVAIVREVEQRQLAAIGDLVPDPAVSYADAMRAWWRHISDPSLWPNERLFFELYGQALQGRPHAEELLDGIVDSWLEPITEVGISMGLPRATAEASARLGIAVTRGMLLDLLATRNREGVDAAMEHWIELNTGFLERLRGEHAGPEQDERGAGGGGDRAGARRAHR
jgi:AcrR family transcriptional regulator